MAKIKTLEEQTELCKVLQQSGLSKAEFCLMNNISFSSFYNWLKKLRGKDAELSPKKENKPINKDGTIKFLKIPATTSSGNSGDLCCLEIALPNGVGFKIKVTPNNMDRFLIGLLTWK